MAALAERRSELEHDGAGAWPERLLDAGSSIREEFGSIVAARFDEELLRFQRRRSIWFCIGAILLFAALLLNDLFVWATEESTGPDAIFNVIDPLIDVALVATFSVFLVAFRRIGGPRRRVVRLLQWLIVLVGCGMTLAATGLWSHVATQDLNTHPGAPVLIAGGTAIVVVFLFHFMGSLLIALSPHESLQPLLPITITYVCAILFLVPGPVGWKVAMIAAWPLAGAPGALWSAWRYRRFVDAFRWRVSQDRYQDLRQDLSEARRLHESLFPAPVGDGPVRFAWMYEPMRELGGDYVFAHRQADGSLLVILLDVAGHGVASALAASRFHGELERLIEDSAEAGAGDALRTLHRFVSRSLAPQGVFASAVAIEIAADGAGRYANAGHPPVLLRRADGRIEQLEATATLLGVVERDRFEPGEQTFRLGLEEGILAFTDGVIEAADARGEFFGLERVAALTAEAGVSGLHRVPPALLEAVQRHRSGQPADDVFVAALWRAR